MTGRNFLTMIFLFAFCMPGRLPKQDARPKLMQCSILLEKQTVFLMKAESIMQKLFCLPDILFLLAASHQKQRAEKRCILMRSLRSTDGNGPMQKQDLQKA